MDVNFLVVDGILRWDTTVDGLTLRAKSIVIVGNGTFECGTSTDPMLNSATIEIKRSNTTDSIYGDDDGYDVDFAYGNDTVASFYEPIVGVRAFAVCGGVTCGSPAGSKPTIRIVGRPLERTWSLLNASVSAGNASITLVDNPTDMGWAAGDRISIATTAGVGKGGESSVYTVLAVAPSGSDRNWVELDTPILDSHIGELVHVEGNGFSSHVRVAAEVRGGSYRGNDNERWRIATLSTFLQLSPVSPRL